uniref:DNA translocase FtsK n=1 Tax=Microvirga aerophila TaxID=670291 RepID=UPI0035A221BC
MLPPIDRLPASPHSQPAVHSQIAKIRAEFAAGLEDAQTSGKIPAAAEEKALSGSEEVAHVQELALTPDTAAEPHITKRHEPTAPWVSSLALTFVWQASSYRRDLGEPGSSVAPVSEAWTVCEVVQDRALVEEGVGGLDTFDPVRIDESAQPLDPAVDALSDDAAVLTVATGDIDLGYLALYTDEIAIVAMPAHAQPDQGPAPTALSNMVEQHAEFAIEPAPEPQATLTGLEHEAEATDAVELPPLLKSLFDEAAAINAAEPDHEALSEDTAELEPNLGHEDPNLDQEPEPAPVLPSAEIIMLPKPTPQREPAAAYQPPDIAFLTEPPEAEGETLSEDVLEAAAGRLEKIVRDFGVRGEVIHVHPGPVVTLYEFEPAPGIKSSRVIALSDDVARSMSAVSARIAVIPGRNAIGIELPNLTRETVYLRELLESEAFRTSTQRMPLCLGKTIGGEAVIADLARMPHLLMAGTTGSGKSVAINTMILSLLYRFTPEECRLIMVDPKMLELSVYDGIPHLLTPVVTD